MKLSRIVGYNNVTREAIAVEVGCVPALITSYFGTMVKLKRAIMRRAIQIEDLNILGQGLAMRDSHALKISDELKAAAGQKIGTF